MVVTAGSFSSSRELTAREIRKWPSWGTVSVQLNVTLSPTWKVVTVFVAVYVVVESTPHGVIFCGSPKELVVIQSAGADILMCARAARGATTSAPTKARAAPRPRSEDNERD